MDNLDHKIWEKALQFLKIRPHSRQELKTKLTAAFREEARAIGTVLDEMERVELVNDRRFTELFITSLIRRPIGRIKIMAETRRRGLDPDLANRILQNLNWSEEESAKEARAEKERTLREADPRKRKMKLANFLRSRGFKEATIYRLLR